MVCCVKPISTFFYYKRSPCFRFLKAGAPFGLSSGFFIKLTVREGFAQGILPELQRRHAVAFAEQMIKMAQIIETGVLRYVQNRDRGVDQLGGGIFKPQRVDQLGRGLSKMLPAHSCQILAADVRQAVHCGEPLFEIFMKEHLIEKVLKPGRDLVFAHAWRFREAGDERVDQERPEVEIHLIACDFVHEQQLPDLPLKLHQLIYRDVHTGRFPAQKPFDPKGASKVTCQLLKKLIGNNDVDQTEFL